MSLNCQLKGTYEDIRPLRRLKGWSAKQLSEALGKTESYLSQLETGKINLTLADYHYILSLLGFSVKIQTHLSLDELKMNLQSKGKMYMKQGEKELAKQLLLEKLEASESDWSPEALLLGQRLLESLENHAMPLTISNAEYPVYEGSDCGNYACVGRTYHLDVETFIQEILENREDLFEFTWSYPTLEGPRVDFYHLLSESY